MLLGVLCAYILYVYSSVNILHKALFFSSKMSRNVVNKIIHFTRQRHLKKNPILLHLESEIYFYL